jgi:NADPH:quinone reductase-like Zn-dependent oxidoreductase
MKAIVQDKYGSPDVLELREIDKPEVRDDDVLVRVHAASVNPADCYAMTGTPYVARTQMGLRKPKSNRPGLDLAGVVEAVGGNVTRFTPGDEVFGGGTGTLAEYVCLAEDRALVLKPANRKVVFFIAKLNTEDLVVVQELLEAGKVTPVVERSYPLSQAADALRYLGQGHAQGKVLITL